MPILYLYVKNNINMTYHISSTSKYDSMDAFKASVAWLALSCL